MNKIPLLLIALTQLFSPSLLASNGVVEINQTCAVQLGCFSGDDPGYPVTIIGQVAKKYRLTSDLIIPNENTNGITLASSYVTIDLNGFSIIRSGCENSSFCNIVIGTGQGIHTSTNSKNYTSLKNGNIIGMGDSGIKLRKGAHIENLKTVYNGNNGITVGLSSQIVNSISSQNAGVGLDIDSGSSVSGNSVYLNNGIGVKATYACKIHNNIIYSNGGSYGVTVRPGSQITNNIIRSNGDYGIEFQFGASSYRANTISDYGTSAFLNTASGINMGANLCNSVVCP